MPGLGLQRAERGEWDGRGAGMEGAGAEGHRRGLQQLRGQRPGLLQQAVHRLDQRPAALVQAAGAAMALAPGDARGVALDMGEGFERQAQMVGGDLREAGLMPLAVGMGAERQLDPAIGAEPDPRPFAETAARGPP